MNDVMGTAEDEVVGDSIKAVSRVVVSVTTEKPDTIFKNAKDLPIKEIFQGIRIGALS